MDTGQADREFAEVLAYLKATRQQATTRLLPDDEDATTLRPSLAHQRKAIARARWKRLRKMARRL